MSDIQCERCGASGPACLVEVGHDIPVALVKRNCASEPRSIFTLRDCSSLPFTTSWPPFCARCFDKVLEGALSRGDKTFGQVFERLRREESKQ